MSKTWNLVVKQNLNLYCKKVRISIKHIFSCYEQCSIQVLGVFGYKITFYTTNLDIANVHYFINSYNIHENGLKLRKSILFYH